MTFLEVANDPFIYFVSAGVLLVVLVVLLAFLAVSLRQAKATGISRERIVLTVRTTLLASIGPALSVLIPFIAMMAVLGIPWSWQRLSVIGSASQEMAVATMALQGGGYEGLGVETRMEAFCLYTLVVAIVYSAGMLINILFNKPISYGLERAKGNKNAVLINVVAGAMFMGLILHITENSLFEYIQSNNAVAIAVMITGLIICFIGEKVIEKYKLQQIKQYSFVIYLFVNMCTALIWTQIL